MEHNAVKFGLSFRYQHNVGVQYKATMFYLHPVSRPNPHKQI